jgi:peptidoglycan/xylan/chitin deacetylase (PgdA/CDA1 family)
LASLAAPGGTRGRLLVLIYHRVLAQPDPLLSSEPDAASFTAQMELLARCFQVLPLSEAVERLATGSLPPRAACITFDDGYVNNLTVAAPILGALGLPATVFVATGFIGAHPMWNDIVIESVRRAADVLDLSPLALGVHRLDSLPAQREALERILSQLKYRPLDERRDLALAIAQRAACEPPRDLMMSEAQIQALAGRPGIEIGAHTVSHPILLRLEPGVAQREIAASKERLEAITGATVATFAYPNGRPRQDYDASHVAMARACGFTAAVSTAWGYADARCDRFQIPRMLPWDRTALRFALRLAGTYRASPAAAA